MARILIYQVGFTEWKDISNQNINLQIHILDLFHEVNFLERVLQIKKNK